MTNPIKLTIGGLLGGGVAIGGGTCYLLNQNKETNTTNSKEKTPEAKKTKTVSEWLNSDNKVLLGEGDETWTNKWGAFKKAHPKGGKVPNVIWGFTDWDPTKLNENGNKFMQKCVELAKSEVNSKEGDIYEEVKTYCTKDKVQVQRPG